MSEYAKAQKSFTYWPGQTLVAEDEAGIVCQSPPRYRMARRVIFWASLGLTLWFAAMFLSVMPSAPLWEKVVGLLDGALVAGGPWVAWMLEYTLRMDLRRGQYRLTRGVPPLRRTVTRSLDEVSHLYTTRQRHWERPLFWGSGPLVTRYTVRLVWRRHWALRWEVALATSEFREEGLELCARLAERLGVPDQGLRDMTPNL